MRNGIDFRNGGHEDCPVDAFDVDADLFPFFKLLQIQTYLNINQEPSICIHWLGGFREENIEYENEKKSGEDGDDIIASGKSFLFEHD